MPKTLRGGGPRPRKELGQHFLQDEEIASRIVQSMNPSWPERAVEIGPGRGVLLRFLLKSFHRVTAIEVDERLKKSLQRTFGGHPGLELIFDDFLRFDLKGYLMASEAPAKLVGNIPYSLSSLILLRLFEEADSLTSKGIPPLRSATLMLQKEVAERISATSGGRSYGGITVQRALVSDAELLFTVPPAAFWPPPQVTSAVVRLDFFAEPRYHLMNDRVRFRELIRHVFAQRRKMLKNTLGSLHWIKAVWPHIHFDLTRRPEELSVEEFIQLYELIV